MEIKNAKSRNGRGEGKGRMEKIGAEKRRIKKLTV